jgi:hypothetical protein
VRSALGVEGPPRQPRRVRNLITHRYRPEECQAAYDGALDRRHEQPGVIFDWRDA